MKKERFEALDGWRGVAAVSVALFHLSAMGHFYYLDVVRQAGMFVDFFFVLSGFVLSYSYIDKLRETEDFGGFITKRFGRIWPLHIFTLTILVALELVKLITLRGTHLSAGKDAFNGTTSPEALITNIVLIHSLGLHNSYTWNGPSWSISVEFWTYIVFAMVTIYAKKYIVAISALIVAISAAILFATHRGFSATYDWGIFRCFCGFFGGVLTYRIYKAIPASRIPQGTFWEVAAVLAVLAFASSFRLLDLSYATPIVFGFVTLVFSQEAGIFSSILKSRPAQKIGLWSYSIYLVHFIVLRLVDGGVRVAQQITKMHFIDKGFVKGEEVDMINFGHSFFLSDLLAVLYLALVVSVASLTYRYVEEPARLFFNGLARKHMAGGKSAVVKA